MVESREMRFGDVESGFKRYPKYRDSGVEWLGEIPAHWKVVELARIGSFLKGRGGTKRDEKQDGIPCIRYGDLYSHHDGFIHQARSCIRQGNAVGYTPIEHGDVLFAASGETLEEIGESAVNLMQSEAVCGGDIILFRSNRSLVPEFMGYAARAPHAVHQKSRMGRGFTVAHIYIAQLRGLRIPLSPLPEQRAIAAFLDRETGRIGRLVRSKERLVELLREKRASLITRAVTKGLDPEVPMKETGIEWLGAIPAHWDLIELGRIGEFWKGRGGTKLDEQETGVPCIRYGDLYTCHHHFVHRARSCVTREMAGNYTSIRYGDVLFAASGETVEDIGKSAVNLVRSEAVCGGDIILFRSQRDCAPKFMGYAMDSPHAAYQKAAMGRGFTVAHIYIPQLRQLRIPLPPPRASSGQL